jgi:hypothetical protein
MAGHQENFAPTVTMSAWQYALWGVTPSVPRMS